jgi:hypothetical protein
VPKYFDRIPLQAPRMPSERFSRISLCHSTAEHQKTQYSSTSVHRAISALRYIAKTPISPAISYRQLPFIYSRDIIHHMPPRKPQTLAYGGNTPIHDLAIKHNVPLPIQLFVQYYLDPDSDTYANAKQSYKRVHANVSDNTAGSYSNHIKHKYVGYIQDLLYITETGIEVRLGVLSRILSGTHERVVRTYTYDKAGKRRLSGETVSTPTLADTIKAIDILNKLDGTYTKQDIAAKAVSHELRDLAKQAIERKDKSASASKPPTKIK